MKDAGHITEMAELLRLIAPHLTDEEWGDGCARETLFEVATFMDELKTMLDYLESRYAQAKADGNDRFAANLSACINSIRIPLDRATGMKGESP